MTDIDLPALDRELKKGAAGRPDHCRGNPKWTTRSASMNIRYVFGS